MIPFTISAVNLLCIISYYNATRSPYFLASFVGRAVIQWKRLPSISCYLITKGEPDIAGLGVTCTRWLCWLWCVGCGISYRTSVIHMSVSVFQWNPDPQFAPRHVSFITASSNSHRVVQLIRSQVSFYHGTVVSNLSQLLGIPLYLILALGSPGINEGVHHWAVQLVDLCGSFTSITVNLLLTVASIRLGMLEGYYTSDQRNGTSLPESPEGFATWTKAVPT